MPTWRLNFDWKLPKKTSSLSGTLPALQENFWFAEDNQPTKIMTGIDAVADINQDKNLFDPFWKKTIFDIFTGIGAAPRLHWATENNFATRLIFWGFRTPLQTKWWHFLVTMTNVRVYCPRHSPDKFFLCNRRFFYFWIFFSVVSSLKVWDFSTIFVEKFTEIYQNDP